MSKKPMQRPDHILIVDDDKDIRELLDAYLQKHGFNSPRLHTAFDIECELSAQKQILSID